METTNTPPRITSKQAAVVLNVNQKTVERWMRNGSLRSVKIGCRYRTTDSWIQEFVHPVECSLANGHTAAKGFTSESERSEARSIEAADNELRARFGMEW